MIKKNIQIFTVFTFFLFAFSACNKFKSKTNTIKVPEGMVWVENKTFLQGAKESDKYAMKREKPAHEVTVDGFFIDITEVTNKQFKQDTYDDALNYLHQAELMQKVDDQDDESELLKKCRVAINQMDADNKQAAKNLRRDANTRMHNQLNKEKHHLNEKM